MEIDNLPCRFLKERWRNVFTFILLSALLSAALVPIFQFVVSSDELVSNYQSTYKRKGSTPGKVRAHMCKLAYKDVSYIWNKISSSVLFANRFKQSHGCNEKAPWPPVGINMNLQHKFAFPRQLASKAPAMNTYANKSALKCWLPSQHCIECRRDFQLNLGVRVVSPINTFPPRTTITQSLIQELWFSESSTVFQNEFQ